MREKINSDRFVWQTSAGDPLLRDRRRGKGLQGFLFDRFLLGYFFDLLSATS
jgi:hypothetical protein